MYYMLLQKQREYIQDCYLQYEDGKLLYISMIKICLNTLRKVFLQFLMVDTC